MRSLVVPCALAPSDTLNMEADGPVTKAGCSLLITVKEEGSEAHVKLTPDSAHKMFRYLALWLHNGDLSDDA